MSEGEEAEPPTTPDGITNVEEESDDDEVVFEPPPAPAPAHQEQLP